MIQVDLSRFDGNFHMVVFNKGGNEVHLDGSPSIGGIRKWIRPMQMLLAYMAGFSTIDAINILRKEMQEFKGIKTIIKGERDEDAVPSVFKAIHVHFVLNGSFELERVRKAVILSNEKYCFVAAMLTQVKVTYSCAVIN